MTRPAAPQGPPRTALCQASADDIRIRGVSLPRELIGHVSFTEMMLFHMLGQRPSPGQVAVLDGCLVALMEHGLTPTAVTARLTYGSAPEAMQGAVAAGLLSVGSLFVGTMEGCALLLQRVAAAPDGPAEARAVVAEHRGDRRKLPGFGHPLHTPIDPRTPALLDLARAHDLHGAHCRALGLLDAAIPEALGRSLPPNATGAIAAVLLDAGLPASILRGVALVSRCAGLVGHILEEQQDPAMLALWHGAEAAVAHAPLDPPEEP